MKSFDFEKHRYKKENILIHIGKRIDCNTSNVIYKISCKKCGKNYIGETSRPVCDRIKEHIGYIINVDDQPTGRHFNSYGHSLEDMSWLAFEKIYQNDTYYRKERESLWIEQFNSIQPNGMNNAP